MADVSGKAGPGENQNGTMPVDRRKVLAGAAASGLAVGAASMMPARAMAQAGGYPAGIANPAGLKLLVSTDGVYTPPHGAPKMKFSFSNPEPSIAFAGLVFGFEIITFENNYGIDPEKVSVAQTDNRLVLKAAGLRWAGGTRTHPGTLTATLEKTPAGAIEWHVETDIDLPVKSVKTIVRGLPMGSISDSANAFKDTGDDEVIYEYPALMGGMATPLIAIKEKNGRTWGISALQTEVRPARYSFFPGPDGFKTQLLYEQAGWDRTGKVTTCRWRIAVAQDFAGVARGHFEAVRKNWKLPNFRERQDAPDWMKHLALVITPHGEHWTGYIHNDFDRQLEILRWTAKQIDPTNVMIFLPGWDGRYYWDYPRFEIGEAMGGAKGFARLINEGKKLGFRFALMFGSNIANPRWENWSSIADAQLRTIYDVPFQSDYVDWDGDRKGEPTMVFMNLAVKSWRDHLKSRISDMLSRYPIDAYFLDICGLWENNPQGDMLDGTRTLVRELAEMHPGIPPIAEMEYDAQMAFIPMNQVPRYPLYPDASFNVVASYEHLSHPAPGRGSSGVHEIGFTPYKPVTIDQQAIPTITMVDDTLRDYRDLVLKDIATAKARFIKRNGWT